MKKKKTAVSKSKFWWNGYGQGTLALEEWPFIKDLCR